jgi:hypothetical protein
MFLFHYIYYIHEPELAIMPRLGLKVYAPVLHYVTAFTLPLPRPMPDKTALTTSLEL